MITDFRAHDTKGLWGARLLEFASLPSTNQWCLENAASCLHGDVAWARKQTAGRGRFERSWSAPAGRGLAFSIVLKSPALMSWAPNLGQAAAIAVRRALARCDIPARLKWPNDVTAPERKIAGLLVEKAEPGNALVVGIGLNVNLTAQDLEQSGIGETATSMSLVACRHFRLRLVLHACLREFQILLDNLATLGLHPLLEEWAAHDTLKGQTVEARTAAACVQGRYAGLTPEGQMRLVDESGTEHRFWTGDVVKILRTG